MKFIFIKFLILLSGTNLIAQTSSDWKWIHPRPQGQYIKWVQMMDDNNWVASGDYGTFMKTSNAGINWISKTGGFLSPSYPGTFTNFLCGYFFNVNTGFLGSQAASGIVKTTNGGQTFDTIRILSSGTGFMYGFHFINQSTGFIAGNAAYKAMKTTNSGLNWLQLPNINENYCYSVYASDTNNVIYTTTGGNVYFTSNGGFNWTVSNVGTTNTVHSCRFLNAMTGYVCGN